MKEGFGNDFVTKKLAPSGEKAVTVNERIKTTKVLRREEGANQERLSERLTPIIERLALLEARKPEHFKRLTERYISEALIDTSDEELLLRLARGLYESEKKIATERGHGADINNLEQSDAEILEKYREAVLDKYERQKATMTAWIEYLTQNDANYPIWFRYYAAHSLKQMGKFNRDTTDYSVRSNTTLAPLPELNAETLAFVHKALEHELILDYGEIPKEVEDKIISETILDSDTEEKIATIPERHQEAAKSSTLKNLRKEARKKFFEGQKNTARQDFFSEQTLNEERQPELEAELDKRLTAKNFADLYAFAQVETAGNLDRSHIEGEWVKYDQGSDPSILENALKGKGTGWCTATGSAEGQLKAGDFYVYFSKNKAGVPTEPRVAVRMANDMVVEIRGIDPGQELELVLIDTAQDFYKDLPGAERYEKATKDMRRLTDIYNRILSNNNKTNAPSPTETYFNVEELQFIFETKARISSFGYYKDPRIAELQNTALHSCSRENIANALKLENVENTTDEQIYKHLTELGLKELSSYFFEFITKEKILKGEISVSDLDIINNLIKSEDTASDVKRRLQDTLKEIADPKFKNVLLEIFNVENDNDLAMALISRGHIIIFVNINYFENLDSTIAFELSKNKRPSFVLDNFKRFKDLDYSTFAIFLLNNRYSEYFIENISLFKELDLNIAVKLIKLGEFETYVNQISCFKKIDFEILARATIDAGGSMYLTNIYFRHLITPEQKSIIFHLIFENENNETAEAALFEIISNANAATIASDAELFKKIITHDNKKLVETFCLRSLEQISEFGFQELDGETTELLINTCFNLKLFKEVADSAHKIPVKYINTEFVISLIDTNVGSFFQLITELKRNPRSDQDDWRSKISLQIDKKTVCEKLINADHYSTLLMTSWFFDLEQNEKTQIASHGIENGLAPDVAHNFESLKGCDFSVYEDLIKKREVGRMLFHILELPEDKLSLAISLVIKTGQFNVLEQNIDLINKKSKESGISYEHLAKEFDFEGKLGERTEAIKILKQDANREGLNIETCRKFIELGAAEEIFNFINNLNGVSEQQVAEMVVDSIQAKVLLKNLHLLKNLDEDKLIERIDKTNQSDLFGMYFTKFKNTLTEKLIRLYLPFSFSELDGNENVEKMIEYSERLTLKLARTLNSSVYGHLVNKYSERFKGETVD